MSGTSGTNSGSNIIYTYGNNSPYSISGTYTYPPPSYTVFKLPRNELPEKIYVNGVLKTCGLLGTDVECAYDGNEIIVFSPKVIPSTEFISLNPRDSIKLSLEYYDEILHYVIDNVPSKGQDPSLTYRLVSTIKKIKYKTRKQK